MTANVNVFAARIAITAAPTELIILPRGSFSIGRAGAR
jgi:hypothetical protein